MNTSFDSVIRILLELRKSQHGDANAKVRDEIDEAVRLLRLMESRDSSEREATKQQALIAVGAVLRSLPSIQRILELLIG